MIVTIEIDMSVDPLCTLMFYQFKIRCTQGSIDQTGILKVSLSYEEAEILCISAAMSALLNSGITGITKVIIIQE